jgi:NAD(P)-dependent dehydrogenase (short-subunit alcohol dehydrogenase family)
LARSEIVFEAPEGGMARSSRLFRRLRRSLRLAERARVPTPSFNGSLAAEPTFDAEHVASLPLIAGGRGGVIILTGSTAGVRPVANPGVGALAYTASKWGLAGMCKQLAATLAEHSIRVNIVHPTGVASGMTMNAAMAELAAQAMAGDGAGLSAMQNAMPVQILQPEDISDAVAFLVSDQAKWITGVSLPVDAGFSVR